MQINFEYGFFFTLNKITGYSIFTDPLNLFQLLILLAAMIFGIYVLHVVWKEYKRTENINSLIFYVAGVIMLIAGLAITASKLSYAMLGWPEIGRLFIGVSWSLATSGMILYNIFAFRTAFPNRVKLLTSIVTVISIFYVLVLNYALFTGQPWVYTDPIDFEDRFSPIILLVIYCTFIPVSLLAPLVFSYFTIKIRDEDRPKSNLAICFVIGLLCIALGVINEVGLIYIFLLEVLFRFFILAYPIVFYLIFAMPDWFRNKLGLEKE